MGLLDSLTALTIVFTLSSLPIRVWMLYTRLKDIPNEILEAARMDGATLWTEVRYVVLPLGLGGLASTGLLCLVLSWNEAFWALNLSSAMAATLATLIASYSSPEGLFPELRQVLPMLERAKHGIEFFGLGQQASAHWRQIKATHGLARFAAFVNFCAILSQWSDYRLFSNAQLQSVDNDVQLDQINAILSRATGNTFTDFVNHVRINRACQLLMESDWLINHIGYEVGFNNIANFNRRFLDIKGMTPSEYRRQVANRFGRKDICQPS